MKEVPVTFQQPIFEKLFHVAEYSQLSKQEKMDYDRSQKYRWDNQNVLDYATSEGEKIGKIKGKEEGGKLKARQIARELKKMNLSMEQIGQVTKLSLKELEKL